MSLPQHQKLRQKASLAMRSGDYPRAIELYEALEEQMPDDPTWPERRAAAYREMVRPRQELPCLLRALELQVDAGRVLAAIATCSRILEIEPEHPSTVECLHLLYTEPAMNPNDRVALLHEGPPPGLPPEPRPTRRDRDAPLVELELTEVIPGARSVLIGGGDADAVSEIPLESAADVAPARPAIELRLELRSRGASKPARSPSDTGPAAADARPAVPARGYGRAHAELARIPLFGSLDASALHAMMERVRVVRLQAGEILFREGDRANALYVVAEGAVVPVAEGPPRKRLAVLEQGAFFGEIGLVTNQPRNATIEALVETCVLSIDRRLMWSLIESNAEVSQVLLRFLRERLIDRHIRTHPLFAGFADSQRDAVVRQFRFLEVKDATHVVEQGRAVDGLFVLLAGEMQIADDERGKVDATLGSGDVFGGLTLLRGGDAPRSVIARGKCWVLALGASRFRRILDADPGLARRVEQLAAGRSGDSLAP